MYKSLYSLFLNVNMFSSLDYPIYHGNLNTTPVSVLICKWLSIQLFLISTSVTNSSSVTICFKRKSSRNKGKQRKYDFKSSE